MGLPLGVMLTLLAIFLGGNAFLQVPIGWLTDRIDRRVLISGCAAVSVLGALWLPGLVEIETRWPLRVVVGLWGGAQLGLYTLGLVRLGPVEMLFAVGGRLVPYVMIVGATIAFYHQYPEHLGIGLGLLIVHHVVRRFYRGGGAYHPQGSGRPGSGRPGAGREPSPVIGRLETKAAAAVFLIVLLVILFGAPERDGG